MAASRIVANYLGTNHHEFTYTIEEGIDAIQEVIYHIETFNQTTIRASIPMYLMARKIKVKKIFDNKIQNILFNNILIKIKGPWCQDGAYRRRSR